MRHFRYYPRNRQVECLARDLLISEGYVVVRGAGNHAPVDLVAWKTGGSVLFIRTGRSRNSCSASLSSVTARFRRDIDYLRRLPRLPYLCVHLWVFFDRQGWRFFEVYPGGILEVENHVE